MDNELCFSENEIDDLSSQIDRLKKQNEEIRKKVSLLKSIKPQTPLDSEFIHFNDNLVYEEMARRGINLRFIPETHVVEATFGSHVELLINSTSKFIPSIYASIVGNKFTTKQLLKEKGYPVPEAKVFDPSEQYEAQEYASKKVGYPVVIKPSNGSCGTFVFCNVQSDSEFRRAFSVISKVTFTPTIMVEEYLKDVDDYRFFLIGGKVVSVVKRTPPTITGNGRSTIIELVESENFRRMNPRNTCLCPIQVDDFESERCLKAQGVTLNTILRAGEAIQCRFNANVSMGGECESYTNKIDISFVEVAASTQQIFPNLSVLVVDLLIQKNSLTAAKGNYWLCECSCVNPGLSLHTHPSKGDGDDIISPLVDMLFPETALKQ